MLQNGRQVWAERDQMVYTVGDPPGKDETLPLENLAYLSVTSQKAVYAEHSVEDDLGDKKGKKAKEKSAGRQRGYVVRVDGDSRPRVAAPLQPAVDRLYQDGVVSRVDAEETAGPTKRRGRGKKEEKAEPVEEETGPPLGPNECRVEVTARCQHFAHGKGFRVEMSEAGPKQKFHVFVADRELTAASFYKQLVGAIEATGGQTALGRMLSAPDDGAAASKKRDVAQEGEEDWLSSVMGRCMVTKKEEVEKSADANEEAQGDQPPEPPKSAKKALPPWLR